MDLGLPFDGLGDLKEVNVTHTSLWTDCHLVGFRLVVEVNLQGWQAD